MNILMVCMGNICRSPMAEGIAKDIASTQQNIMIDSAGTHSYHVGHAPDKRAIKIANNHGIDISSLKARIIEPRDLDKFDVIMVADEQNLTTVRDMAKTAEQRKKIIKMLSSHPTKTNEDLPDPYYADEEAFEETYQLLHSAFTQWFDKL